MGIRLLICWIPPGMLKRKLGSLFSVGLVAGLINEALKLLPSHLVSAQVKILSKDNFLLTLILESVRLIFRGADQEFLSLCVHLD